MDAAALFAKWQRWVRIDLHDQFVSLIRNKVIFDAFLRSINPYTGRADGAEIAEWIGLNYFAAACIDIRRLDDNDSDSISLRRLLVDLKANASVLTEANLRNFNGLVITGGHADDPRLPESMGENLAKEIALLDTFGRAIKKFVNKRVAHLDKRSLTVEIPNLRTLEEAVLCYHHLYRKYTLIIGGLSCQLNDPNPLDLLAADDDIPYEQQFSRIWKGEDHGPMER